MPQEPLLFHRSLFENIAYSNVSATHAEVVRAATLAHADEFIRELPGGYDTLVGERGIKLSGGQRQRIAIARALVHDPLLLLADEPTGNLDEGTGESVLALLDRLTRQAGKNLLMVTHSPESASRADRVFHLRDGKLETVIP